MRKQASYIFFIGGLLFQLWLALRNILPLAPPPNQWGLIDEVFYTILYVVIGVFSIGIYFFKRLDYILLIIVCSLITLYFTIGTLAEHSGYYHNQGQLGFFINMDRNPILFYDYLYKYPPRIGVIYTLITYNIAVIVFVLLAKRERSKNN